MPARAPAPIGPFSFPGPDLGERGGSLHLPKSFSACSLVTNFSGPQFSPSVKRITIPDTEYGEGDFFPLDSWTNWKLEREGRRPGTGPLGTHLGGTPNPKLEPKFLPPSHTGWGFNTATPGGNK